MGEDKFINLIHDINKAFKKKYLDKIPIVSH